MLASSGRTLVAGGCRGAVGNRRRQRPAHAGQPSVAAAPSLGSVNGRRLPLPPLSSPPDACVWSHLMLDLMPLRDQGAPPSTVPGRPRLDLGRWRAVLVLLVILPERVARSARRPAPVVPRAGSACRPGFERPLPTTSCDER